MERQHRGRRVFLVFIAIAGLFGVSLWLFLRSIPVTPLLLREARKPLRDARAVAYCDWLTNKEALVDFGGREENVDLVSQRHTAVETTVALRLHQMLKNREGETHSLSIWTDTLGTGPYYAALDADTRTLARALHAAAAQPLRFFSYVVSPSKEYILWDAGYVQQENMAFWYRLLPKRSLKRAYWRALWITRKDGSSPRLLGVVKVDYTALDREEWLQNSEWLPDSREISFLYGHTLYTLSAVR